jgi:zinc protease
MKRLVFLFIVCSLSVRLVNAQPEAQSFNVDGIKVIFKPTEKKVVNIRIYYRGGVTNYPAGKAGIENLALAAAVRCGSAKYTVNALKDTVDRYGIWLTGASTYDFGYIELNCVSKYFNQGWDLFSQAVTTPIFDARELDLLKNTAIAYSEEQQSNPDHHLQDLQLRNAFRNTPYAINPIGTRESLSGLSSADLADYYKTLLNQNKIFIVAVGNISKQELYERILGAFGNIPARPYTWPDLRAPVLNDNKLLSEAGDLKTNYVGAIMNAPEYTSIYYVPFCLGMTGLGGNLYQYLNTNLNLSFSPDSETGSLRMPYAVMTAGTAKPQEAMTGMINVLKTTQQGGLNEEWLQHIKNSYITNSYINDQSAAQITASLGQAEILGGWQYADDLTKLVQMTTLEQVNAALNTYIMGLRWTYLGNTEAIEGFKPPVY